MGLRTTVQFVQHNSFTTKHLKKQHWLRKLVRFFLLNSRRSCFSNRFDVVVCSVFAYINRFVPLFNKFNVSASDLLPDVWFYNLYVWTILAYW